MKTTNPLRRRATRLLLSALALLPVLSAAPAFAAGQVVLQVGDQNYYNIRASVEAANALEGASYRVEWKHFQAAAPIAEALDSAALDLGFLGDSGLLFLAAKGAPVKVVGVSRQNQDGVALLVAKDAPYKTLADLKGRKVAIWPGAWSQQLVHRALEKQGLPQDYVELVKVMPIDASAALQGGKIDAFPVWEPYISQLVVSGQARPLLTAKGLMPAISTIAANADSAKAKREAIADFLLRVKRAREWVNTHQEDYAARWARTAKLEPETVQHWFATARMVIEPVNDAAVADLRDTADFLHKSGAIATPLDIDKVVDRSFGAALAP